MHNDIIIIVMHDLSCQCLSTAVHVSARSMISAILVFFFFFFSSFSFSYVSTT